MAAPATKVPATRTGGQEWLSQFWAGLAVRERFGVGVAVAAVLVLLVWVIGVQPAWRTLKAAPRQHAALDAQLDTMRALAAQAKAVQATPKISLGDATRALEQLSASLGSSAELRVQGDRATLRVRAVSGEALANWLPRAREQARALPSEVKLTRAVKPSGAFLPEAASVGAQGSTSGAAKAALGPAAAASDPSEWTWDGTIVLVIAAQ